MQIYVISFIFLITGLVCLFLAYKKTTKLESRLVNNGSINFPNLPYSIEITDIYNQINHARKEGANFLTISVDKNISSEEFKQLYRGLVSYNIGVEYFENQRGESKMTLDFQNCVEKKLSVRMPLEKTFKNYIPHELMSDKMFKRDDSKNLNNVIYVDFKNRKKVS